MHYTPGSGRPHPLIANLRAHILSVRAPQQRFIVRGTQGTFTKCGIDVQEEQLKVIKSPSAIFEEDFGKEPQALWGTVENIESDGVSIRKATWVTYSSWLVCNANRTLRFNISLLSDGLPQKRDLK